MSVSALQQAGPYAAGVASLAWNAWITWHRRRTYACTVSWREPVEPADKADAMRLTNTLANSLVFVHNIGDAPLYDVALRFGDTPGALHAHVALVDDFTRMGTWATDALGWTQPISLTYRHRPGGRRRFEFFGTTEAGKLGEEVSLIRRVRGRAFRDGLSRRIAPPA